MPDLTHEVFNQPEPLVDYNLFEGNRALRDALKLNAPRLDTAPLVRPGRDAGQRATCRPMRGWPTCTRRNCAATTASAGASTRSNSIPATTR